MPFWENNCIDDWETKLIPILNEKVVEEIQLISGIPLWVQMYYEKLQEREEKKILVGSIYQLGETLIQATKPRVRCVKLGIRFQDAKVIKQFWNTTKSGVYFKILKTGNVAKKK